MTQHTPGPWTLANQGHDGWAIYVRRFGVIALMGSFDAHPEPQAEQAANARLIAAAPQMLEALQRVMSYPAVRNALECDDNDAALAAIAAATGTPT